MPVETEAESSLQFCQICDERKENDQMIKTQKCKHFVCLDCSLIKMGKCPLPSCDPAPKSGAFKEFLPQDLSFLWKKASSVNPVPDPNCRRTKQVITRWKPKEATASSVPEITPKIQDKGPKQVLSSVKNQLPLLLKSRQLLKQWLDSDSDLCSDSDSDDYDSDASPRTPESCRKSKWFEKFDKELEIWVSRGEMNGVGRKWHCPVCPKYARAFRSYQGLQSLVRHAKTQHSTRVRLHLELVHLIEDRLKREAITSKPAAEWRGLKKDKGVHEIVWPPMVVVSYSVHKTDEKSGWIGVTNQELMEIFSLYNGIVEAQQCHHIEPLCGMSILVFESSVMGYLESERLHNRFVPLILFDAIYVDNQLTWNWASKPTKRKIIGKTLCISFPSTSKALYQLRQGSNCQFCFFSAPNCRRTRRV